MIKNWEKWLIDFLLGTFRSLQLPKYSLSYLLFLSLSLSLSPSQVAWLCLITLKKNCMQSKLRWLVYRIRRFFQNQLIHRSKLSVLCHSHHCASTWWPSYHNGWKCILSQWKLQRCKKCLQEMTSTNSLSEVIHLFSAYYFSSKLEICWNLVLLTEKDMGLLVNLLDEASFSIYPSPFIWLIVYLHFLHQLSYIMRGSYTPNHTVYS